MRRIALMVAGLCIACVASPASAVFLYGVSYDQKIVQIDRTTGTITPYLSTPGMHWFGATDGPTAASFFATGDGGSLYQVNVQTNTITPVGVYGATPAGIKSLAYAEPDSLGGSGVLYASDYQKLYTIDLSTGAATLVGPITPASGLFIGVWSMDYDPVAKALYIVNVVNHPTNGLQTMLYQVNPSNGAATLVGQVSGASSLADIWYDHDLHKMLAVRDVTGQLYEINTTTAVATAIGTAPNENILGLGSAITPEPGMIAMLAFGAVGFLFRTARRRMR